jgi:hypothetical protein
MMSRDFREPRSGFSQLVQRYAFVTFGLLLLLVVASIVFVYQVSPLRDASFQPDSANAGSLLPWLQGVHEATWFLGSALLAGLLATNLVLLLWQWSQPRSDPSPKFLLFMLWSGVGVILFSCLKLMFVGYLMAQWLID